MKSAFFLLFSVVSLLSLAQKNNDKVRLISKDTINYFYKYDEQDRITELRKSNESFHYHYIYLGDTAVIKQYVDLLDTTLAAIALLDKNGLITAVSKFYYDDVMVVQNEYDSNNKLIIQKVNAEHQKSYYTTKYVDENIVEQVGLDTTYDNGRIYIKKQIIKTTHTAQLNPLQNNVIDDELKSYGNKNLTNTVTVEFYSSDFCNQLPCPFLPENHRIVKFKFDYMFDKDGRIITEISTNVETNEKRIAKYYYY